MRENLKPSWDNCSQQVVIKYFTHLEEKGNTPTSVACKKAVVNSFFDYMVGSRCLKDNLVRDSDRRKVTDTDLANLKGLASLQELALSYTKVTDAGLAYLGGLISLKKLFLVDTQISDTGLAHINGLISLEVLFLFTILFYA